MDPLKSKLLGEMFDHLDEAREEVERLRKQAQRAERRVDQLLVEARKLILTD